MVTPLVKHKIVKKRLKPFLRNQSDGKLAMGVRAPCRRCAAVAAGRLWRQRRCCLCAGSAPAAWNERSGGVGLSGNRASARRARVWGPLWARKIRAA